MQSIPLDTIALINNNTNIRFCQVLSFFGQFRKDG